MKKWNFNNKYVGWGITSFLVIIGAIIFYYLMFHGEKFLANIGSYIGILMPVVFGLCIAYLLTPVLNWFEQRIFVPLCKKLKIKDSNGRKKIIRGLSIFLTVLLFFFLIFELFSMLISEIVPSIVNISSHFDDYVNNFTIWLNKLLEDNPDVRDNAIKVVDRYSIQIDTWINNTLLTKSSEILRWVSVGLLGSLKVAWNFMIGLIISVYVMANKEKFTGQFKKIIYAFFEANTGNIIVNNFKFTHRTFSGFINGKVVDSILIGCLCFAGTALMGTPYAALVSVIIGVTNIIPFFGPYLGAIPSLILIFMVDPLHPLQCLYFGIFILILQQFDGNILGPKILGSSTGLTSFWVIFAITLFGGIWGIFGMIVGVPIFAVLYAAFRSYINTRLRRKSLPTESDLYTNVCAVDATGLHDYTPEFVVGNKDPKKNTRYGQKFLSDFDQIVDGNYMNRIEENKDNSEEIKNENCEKENKSDTETIR